MNLKKLQFKLLSSSGELLKVVNAPAGNITVLRAFNPQQLEPYKRAIKGVPGPEKIVVSINGDEFVPDDQILIGFGESYKSISGTVSSQFVGTDCNPNTVPGILLAYGLQDVMDQRLSKLTECQAQRLRLLVALHQSKKCIALNNPFEPISSEWRERFAELLVSHAKTKSVPILITSMTYRPECFINNELILRTQVGDIHQRTIGFGQAPSEFQDLISELRSSALEKPEISKSGHPVFPDIKSKKNDSKLQQSKQKSQKHKIKKSTRAADLGTMTIYGVDRLLKHKTIRKFTFAGGGLLVVFIALLLFSKSSNTNDNQVALQKPIEQSPIEKIQPEEKQNLPKFPSSETNTSESSSAPIIREIPSGKSDSLVNVETDRRLPAFDQRPPESDLTPIKNAKYVLDSYEISIKNSILASFEGSESARAANMQYSALGGDGKRKRSKLEEPQDNSFTRDLLRDLARTTGSGENLPDSPTAPTHSYTASAPNSSSDGQSLNYQDMSQEERRAFMRERFRLAIERAAQNR